MTRRVAIDRLTVGVAVLLAFGAVAWWVLGSGEFASVQGRSYDVTVVTPRAGSLGPGSRVRTAGVEVGRVTEVRLTGAGAALDLELEDAHDDLPVDSTFGVRLHTLVGENYVDIRRGRSPVTVPDGGVLPASRAQDYVDADEILSTLRGPVQVGARRVLRALGGGIDGRGEELNRLVEHAGGFISAAGPVTRVLDEERHQLRALIDDLGSVSRAVGERGDAVRALATDAGVTFRAVGAQDRALRRTLRELPPTLEQVRSTSGTLRRTHQVSTPVLRELDTTLRQAGPVVAGLEPAAVRGVDAVRELGRASPRLEETLRRLERFSPPVVDALPEVEKLLCQANPAVAYLKPYRRDLGGVVAGLGSVTNYYDATGHAARLLPTATPHLSGLQLYDQKTLDAVSLLTKSGIVDRVATAGYNPLPAPGQARGGTVGRDATGPATVKQRYSRVEAAC